MSTPLREVVNINIHHVNCQYFVWPPSLYRTAFTLLGMEFTRASQVATRMLFHSFMTTSRSGWIFETLCTSTFRLRIPQRCSIGFKSGDMLGQSIIFTLNLFSKAVVVLEVGLSHCHAGILLCDPVSGGRGSCSTAVFHNTCWSSCFPQCFLSTPAALMQPLTHLSLYYSPGRRHTCLKPSEPNKLIFLSSDHRTWFQ